MKVALFITCFNDTLFPDTGRAVVTLLERLGHEVAFPEEQTCCGQMHFNSGYADDGLALARRFERVFEPYEAIVSPSASCVGMVRDHCPAIPYAPELLQALSQAKARPVSPVYPQISQAIYKNVNDALAGRVSPAAAIKKASTQIDSALSTF